jgi:transcriptional regulator with XRE-family HTH domain
MPNGKTDPAEFSRQLGALLRATRMARGWSLYDVADRFPGQLPPMTLQSYELGRRKVPLQKLAAIAAFYHVQITDLIP